MNMAIAALEKWARQTSPGFVRAVGGLLGALRDGIKSAQLDLSYPYVFCQSVTVPAGQIDTMTINLDTDGEVDAWTWYTSVIGNPADNNTDAGVVRVQIGAVQMFQSLDGIVPSPNIAGGTGANSGYSGPTAVNGSKSLPSMEIGNLRRIPVSKNDTIQVDVVNNNPTDEVRITFITSQYRYAGHGL